MLVQLNTGKVLSLDAVATIDIKGTKVCYLLLNNIYLTENFDTEEEAEQRVQELFDFNYELDTLEYNAALNVANRIRGRETNL